jgi:hypothetical protein
MQLSDILPKLLATLCSPAHEDPLRMVCHIKGNVPLEHTHNYARNYVNVCEGNPHAAAV